MLSLLLGNHSDPFLDRIGCSYGILFLCFFLCKMTRALERQLTKF
jgi:hypothetical protein